MKKTQSTFVLPVYTIIVSGVALLLMLMLIMSTVTTISRRSTTRVQWYPPAPQSQQRPNQPNENVRSTVNIIEPEEISQSVNVAE